MIIDKCALDHFKGKKSFWRPLSLGKVAGGGGVLCGPNS